MERTEVVQAMLALTGTVRNWRQLVSAAHCSAILTSQQLAMGYQISDFDDCISPNGPRRYAEDAAGSEDHATESRVSFESIAALPQTWAARYEPALAESLFASTRCILSFFDSTPIVK